MSVMEANNADRNVRGLTHEAATIPIIVVNIYSAADFVVVAEYSDHSEETNASAGSISKGQFAARLRIAACGCMANNSTHGMMNSDNTSTDMPGKGKASAHWPSKRIASEMKHMVHSICSLCARERVANRGMW